LLDAHRAERYDAGLLKPAFLLRLGALSASLLPLAAFASGGIFKYVEKDGTIVYTNVAPSGAKAAKARRVEGEFRPAPPPTAPAPKRCGSTTARCRRTPRRRRTCARCCRSISSTRPSRSSGRGSRPRRAPKQGDEHEGERMTSTARRDPATDEEFLAQLYKGG